MWIRVNGEDREVSDDATVADLLTSLGFPAPRVAVEVNLEVVPRARFTEVRFTDGDVVEIVGFVGGG